MPFPHKTATQIEYMRELANIASTLAACQSHECQAAAELIGQEVQALISPPAQEGPKHAGDEQPGAWTYTQSSPAMSIGEAGTPVDPLSVAVEAMRRACSEFNECADVAVEARGNLHQVEEGREKAQKAYQAAFSELEKAIAASVAK